MTNFSLLNVLVDQVTGEVGPRFLSVVEPLLRWFRQEDVAPTIATGMVAYAILRILIHCLVRVLPAWQTLNRPIGFLKKIENPKAFGERFDDFDALMACKGFLRHGWEEFRKTLIFHDLPHEPVVKICVRPSVFLNAADAEHDGLKMKSLSHLSGIFISLGLLFTFIGLVAALSLAAGTIKQVVATAGTLVDGTTADAQAKLIQQALAELLKTASFKFWTSIAGLLSGIIVGVFERISMHTINGKFDKLNRHLERVTWMVTPEIIADRTYKEIRDQSAHMKDFTTQFRFNITESLQDALMRSMPPVMTNSVSDALRSNMPIVMSEAMAPVVSTLEGMTSRLTSMNEDAIKQMTGDFGNVVSQSAGIEIRAVADTLSLMPAQIAEAVGEIKNASVALTEGVNRNAEQVAQAVGSIVAAGRQAEASVGKAAAEVAQTMTTKNKEAAEQVIDVLSTFKETVDGLWQHVEELTRALGTVEQRIGLHAVALEGTTRAARDTETAMSGSARSLTTAAEQVAQAVGSIVAAGRQTEMTASALERAERNGIFMIAKDGLMRFPEI